MRSRTFISLTGHVTREPELRTTPAGDSVCTIRMGVSERILDRATGEWRDGEPSYYDISCWRKLSENVAHSLKKGDMITVHGRCRIKTWVDRNNNPRTQLEITADSVGHEIAFGWSAFNRNTRPRDVEEASGLGEADRQDLGAFGDTAFPDADRNPFDDDYASGGFAAPDDLSGLAGLGDAARADDLAGPAAPPPPGNGPEAGAPEAADGQRLEDAAVPA